MLAVRQDIAKLDRRVTFQRRVLETNVSNEDEEAGWLNINNKPTVWGSRLDKVGSESYAADKLTAFQAFDFIIRFRADIDGLDMRLVCEGKAHNIVSIQEIGRRRYLGIVTEAGYPYVEDVDVTPVDGVFDETFDPSFQ